MANDDVMTGVGQRLTARYLLLDEIGRGGQGRVYRAHDRLTDEVVALKQLNKARALPYDDTSIADNSMTIAREFEFLASLRHPGIINVLDYGFADDGSPFFTMTFLEDARDLLAASEQAPSLIERIGRILRILEALIYLHRRDVIHRDLKPSNVLVSPAHGLKLLDFGLAINQLRDQNTQTGGTLKYMAPELFEGKPSSMQSDLFAVGIMLYHLLTGSYPFEGKGMLVIESIKNAEPDWSRVPITIADDKASSIVDRVNAPTRVEPRAFESETKTQLANPNDVPPSISAPAHGEPPTQSMTATIASSIPPSPDAAIGSDRGRG